MIIDIAEDERKQLLRIIMIIACIDNKNDVLEIDWEVMDGFLRKIEQ